MTNPRDSLRIEGLRSVDDRVLQDIVDAFAFYRDRVQKLELALKHARQWGISSLGYSATEARNLAEWIDAGMVGKPPKPECAFAKMFVLSGKEGQS